MSATAPSERPRRAWRIAAVVGVVFALFAIFQDLDWLALDLGLTVHGDFGMDYAPLPGSRTVARVTAVVPGSPAAAAGIVAGDVGTMLDPPQPGRGPPGVGETMRFAIDHGGARRLVTLTAAPSHRKVNSNPEQARASLSALLADLPAVFLGLFILVRGRGQPSTVLLGVALAAFGDAWPHVASPSVTWQPLVTLGLLITGVSQLAMYAGFLAFGVRMLNEASGRRWRWQRPAFALYLGLLFVGWAILEVWFFNLKVPVDLLPAQTITGVAYLAGLSGGVACLAAGWVVSPAAEKPRYALLVAASACIFANQATNDVYNFVLHIFGADTLDTWQMQVANVLAGVIAPILFAYAILRHRVLDLGFALNRTLVYSIVSAILLGAFGLIEWAVDHFVKIEGREQNALIDAAIALVVYLGFHRVTGVVEHAVEALFFRRWQEKAAELRRFVADAAFIGRRDNLLTAFAAALGRFADGAEAAVYLADGGQAFARAAGPQDGAPARIDADDPALVRMRAERTPVEPAAAGSNLPAELVCPMIHRGELTGFALLAGRTAGVAYRPDETELLGWAALQVGVDLHALEVEQLQAAVTRLEHQLEGARLAAHPA